MTFDPRLTPARDGIAAAHLRGTINAERYVDGTAMRVGWESLALTSAPDPQAELASELLYGEGFTVYDTENGWAWGQSNRDGYVGWVEHDMLKPMDVRTHHVTLFSALTYATPDMKSRPLGALPFLAQVAVHRQEGPWVQTDFGWLPGRHLAQDPPDISNWVTTAERFIGAPYLWGGRTPKGLDCSALVQLSRQSAGFECPRDSDMQQKLGTELGADAELCRGDLIFWKGHVGIMLDAATLLHANAFHMACVREPLALACDRIAAQGGGGITARKRL